MPKSLYVRWEVEGGYRPHRSEVYLENLYYEGVDAQGMFERIEEVVQGDFDERISWAISNHEQVESAVQDFLAGKAKE